MKKNQWRDVSSFAALLEDAKILFWRQDLKNRIVTFSTFAHWDTNGLDRDDWDAASLSLSDFQETILPQDRSCREMAIATCLSGERERYVTEYRIRDGKGDVAWVAERGCVSERDDTTRRPTALIGIRQDVNRLKLAESESVDRQKLLDIAADLTPLAYWEWDSRCGRLHFSDHFRNLCGGYEVSRLADEDGAWLAKIHPDDQNRVSQAFHACLAGHSDRSQLELRIRDGNGDYIWTVLSAQVAEWVDGFPVRFLGCLSNVDSLKRTEEALHSALRENKKQNERLQHEIILKGDYGTAPQLGEPRFHQDRLLHVVNTLATELMGCTDETFDVTIEKMLMKLALSVSADRIYILKNSHLEEERILSVLYGWSPPSSESDYGQWEKGTAFQYAAFDEWERSLEDGDIINARVQDLTGPKRSFFEDLSVRSLLIVPIHLQNEFWGVLYLGDTAATRHPNAQEAQTVHAAGILAVLSILRHEARRCLKQAIARAESSTRAKTLFLANMSHEIKTPLNAIMGMTVLAKESPARAPSYLEHIASAAERLLTVINDVLDISALETDALKLNRVEFSFGDVFDGVYEANVQQIRHKSQKITMDTVLLDTKHFVGDPERMTQVLNHLVSNAVKFTPEGGMIRISATELKRDATHSDICISVHDDGIGIDENIQDSLFIPFEQAEKRLTRNYEGTGLGLAIARGIVQAMGGDINFKSACGEGTTLTITLRLPHTYKQRSEEPAVERTYDFSGKRILLVEDNEINRMIILSMLEETRVEIDCAENGADAVRMVADRGEDGYDLIFMDIHMPIMDGYEATERIRGLDTGNANEVPIVAITANNFPDDIQRGQNAGMDGHIAKPVDVNLLLETVQQLLNP